MKPSEAYEFAYQPAAEWEEAVHAHKVPAHQVRPDDVAKQRAEALCPSFAIEDVSGEELYWLAKLCQRDHAKALTALHRYLAGSELAHGPDARLLLAVLQMRTTGTWEAAWGTIRTLLQEDPIEPVQGQIDGAIDDEATANPQEALKWSEERYAILLDRSQADKPGMPPVSPRFALIAGSDLVHRYYLAGQTDKAMKLLEEMNGFAESHPEAAQGWGAEDLHWANLEMHPAPPVAVVKLLGRTTPSRLIQTGRVELVSFFLLGCAPCMSELPSLNALQKRYGRKLLVTDVTAYALNSYLEPPTHSNIEASIERVLLKKAPGIEVAITSDTTLATYGIHSYPVVALVDKMGRLRYVGHDVTFEDDDPIGFLIRKLIQE
jgi:thiol-disulfide isomerase/thioredoxin